LLLTVTRVPLLTVSVAGANLKLLIVTAPARPLPPDCDDVDEPAFVCGDGLDIVALCPLLEEPELPQPAVAAATAALPTSAVVR
jgi:hypothetical protein